MSTFDGAAFGREIVDVVKSYLERQLSPLEQRLAILEAKAGIEKAKPTIRVKAAGREQ
jgi:hypothetical protein